MMKAYKLVGRRRMELVEVARPKISKRTDVIVKLGAVGVCGSDIHYYSTGRIGEQVVEYPFTVGHECAGVVVDVGSDVRRVSVGDRVAVEPSISCGVCDQCRRGRENTCRNNLFLGCPGQVEGGLAEYLIMPEGNLFPIADDLDMGSATVSEPLAIGVYAVRQAGLTADDKIGVLGMGPIGRTVMLPAIAAGCAAVYCTDRIPERCAAAAHAGAAWVGNPTEMNVVEPILQRESLGLDVVFECCGQQEALDDAVQLLRPGGKLMLIGIPETDRISFCPHTLRRKEVTVVNVRRQRGCVRPALELIEGNRAQVDQLITHRFPLEEADQAFELVADYRDGVIKAMIEFD